MLPVAACRWRGLLLVVLASAHQTNVKSCGHMSSSSPHTAAW
jgi:hypothetical protein